MNKTVGAQIVPHWPVNKTLILQTVPLLRVRVITGDGLEYEELQSLIDFKSVAAYSSSLSSV